MGGEVPIRRMHVLGLALLVWSAAGGTGCDAWKSSLAGNMRDGTEAGGSGGNASGGSGGGTGTGGAAGAGGAAGTGGGSGGSGGSSSAACVKIKDGGPTSCKDSATWKMYGLAACAQQNLTLADISWDVACSADHYQQVTYVCCGGCSLTIDALGNSCTTCTDATGAIVSSSCSNSGVTCEESTGTDGASCKTCRYPDGRILSAECSGGDGGTGATEICDVRTTSDGSPCKVCWEPDGSMLSTCPPDPA